MHGAGAGAGAIHIIKRQDFAMGKVAVEGPLFNSTSKFQAILIFCSLSSSFIFVMFLIIIQY